MEGIYGDYKENKGFRLLDIHEKLNKGELLVKSDFMQYL